MVIFTTFCIISAILYGIYLIYNSFEKIPFECHKKANVTYDKELSYHSDLNKFLEEFESVKSILGISKDPFFSLSENYFKSLFQIDFNGHCKTAMNANVFKINDVKYIAKNFSDYKKATKVIQDHYNYCKENNIYSNWI